MRSLLAKSGITVFIVLSLGTGLAWASTPSKPGMFLYPVKQTTQKAAQIFGSIPAADTRPTDVAPQLAVTDDRLAPGPTSEPNSTATATHTATVPPTRAPTPAQAVNKILPTATVGADPDTAAVSAATPTPGLLIQWSDGASPAGSENRDSQDSQRAGEASDDDSGDNPRPGDKSEKSDSESSSRDSSSRHDD